MRQWQRQFDRNVWGKAIILWWVTVDHLNANSTCDCWHRAGLECESVRMLMFARTKTTPEQRFASQVSGFSSYSALPFHGLIT